MFTSPFTYAKVMGIEHCGLRKGKEKWQGLLHIPLL